MGGKTSSSIVEREGILDNAMVGTGGTGSPPLSAAKETHDALNDVRVGDTGSGGISSEDDIGGR